MRGAPLVGFSVVPAGEFVAVSTSGSGTFVVPAGVTSLCLGVVMPGGNGTDDGSWEYGGNGGDAGYVNDFPVVEGSVIAYNLATGLNTIRQTSPAAAPILSVTFKGNPSYNHPAAVWHTGGAGGEASGTTAQRGGGAGTFRANGASGGAGSSRGAGYDPRTDSTGNFGGGGSSGASSLKPGDPGILVIRWGPLAQFPGARLL